MIRVMSLFIVAESALGFGLELGSNIKENMVH